MTDASDPLAKLTSKIDDLTAMVADHEANLRHEQRKFELLCEGLVRRDLEMAQQNNELWALVKEKQKTAKRLQRRLDRMEGSLPVRAAYRMRGVRKRVSRDKSRVAPSAAKRSTPSK